MTGAKSKYERCFDKIYINQNIPFLEKLIQMLINSSFIIIMNSKDLCAEGLKHREQAKNLKFKIFWSKMQFALADL